MRKGRDRRRIGGGGGGGGGRWKRISSDAWYPIRDILPISVTYDHRT